MKPVNSQKQLQALQALEQLGLPAKLLNERSALVLLGFLGLRESDDWKNARNPLLGTHGLMAFIRSEYGKEYAPNTRETIRKDTIHHLVESGLLLKNPDQPDRPTNSPNTVYSFEEVALETLRTFGGETWAEELARYKASVGSLRAQYAQERKAKRVPLRLPSGKVIQLSPGGQSLLVKKILDDFCTQFTPDAEVVYVSDTADRFAFFETSLLQELGVRLPEHGKLPDVVVYLRAKNWLFLIEAVASGGEIDAKRRTELQKLFLGCRAGLVYVTAFQNRQVLKKFLATLAWETEVWVADDPTHLIHLNGTRFLGPYEGG